MFVQICLLFHTNCTTHPTHHNLLHFFKDLLQRKYVQHVQGQVTIVPLTNLNKYLHNGIGETEMEINIGVNKGRKKILKKKTL